MSYIPDCRTDENYNVEALNENEKKVITGYDWCADDSVPGFFANLNVYFEEDSYIMHILNEKVPNADQGESQTYWDKIKDCLADWIEMQRDEIITSMIDNHEE